MKTSKVNILLYSVLLSLFFSSFSHAHVKWFVDTENAALENFQPYSFSDPEVLIWIALGTFIVFMSGFLDSKIPVGFQLNEKSQRDVKDVFRIITGVSFLLTAYDGAVIAPHYSVESQLGVILVVLQAIIGILFISNLFLIHASLLTIVLYTGAMSQYGTLEVLEYCNIVGIAIFLLLNNVGSQNHNAYSLPLLRIFTGLSLILLGISEKLTGALYGQVFIDMYQWNFMQQLGIEFYTDRLLVLSAGVMEIVFGTILIFGTTTRLNTLVLSCFLMLSNITFLVQGEKEEALLELIGHMPIIASAIILLAFGSGDKLKITTLIRKRGLK